MRSATQGIACAALILAASQASAAVVTFNTPDGEAALGYQLFKDGFQVENSLKDSASYYHWDNGSSYSAGPKAILANYPSTTNTFSRIDGSSFAFSGIDLANAYNTASASKVDFVFEFANGATLTQTVQLNIPNSGTGFQHISFDPAIYSNLTDLTFTPERSQLNADDNYLQFNNFGVDASVSAVPLPALLPMFGGAVLALGGLGFSLRRRTGRDNAAMA